MKFIKCAFSIPFLACSLAGMSKAADIEFIFFENADKKLEAAGLLDPQSRFHKELMLAGIYLGNRIDSDATLRIGIYADQNFGGSAWGRPSGASPSEWTLFGNKQVNIRTPAALATVYGSLALEGSCETHMEMGLDFSKLNPASNVGILGVYMHEFMHGLGVTASSHTQHADGSLTNMSLYDTLIVQDPDNPDVFLVGGENVERLYGRKVRLKEIFHRSPLSHIGGSSTRSIGPSGEVRENAQYSNLGKFSNQDVNSSITGAANSYIFAPSMTAIDLGILKDLGYPISPINSVFFYHAQEDFPPSSFNVFATDFYNVLTIPMLRLDDQVFTAHMAWDGNLGFRVLGVANNGEHGFLQLSGEAPDVFQSTAATLDLGSGLLHVPYLEIYEAGSVGSYSALLRMVTDEAPILFELLELSPIEQQPSVAGVSFRMCEDAR